MFFGVCVVRKCVARLNVFNVYVFRVFLWVCVGCESFSYGCAMRVLYVSVLRGVVMCVCV